MYVWRIVASSITLLIIGLGIGCEGFFVDPVLTGITVGPAATIQTGETLQMSAVGTYDDGTQKSLSSGVHWSSASPSIAKISESGLVTAVGTGQSIISGASSTVSGSVTVTVSLGGLTSIQVTSGDGFTGIVWGSTEQFVATGTANGQQFDITESVSWTTNPSTIQDVSIDSNTGLLTTTSGRTDIVQFEVIATDPPTGISDHMTFTVHP
jgi:hypothetical protein